MARAEGTKSSSHEILGGCAIWGTWQCAGRADPACHTCARSRLLWCRSADTLQGVQMVGAGGGGGGGGQGAWRPPSQLPSQLPSQPPSQPPSQLPSQLPHILLGILMKAVHARI